MKVLFVASGNHGKISPVVKVQGDSLAKEGVDVDYFLVKGRGIKGYLSQIRPLRRFWKAHPCDVVHAHFSFSAYVASLAGIKPLVVSLMGSDLKASRWNRWMIRLFAKVFRWREIIVKSKDMEAGLGIRGVHVIPNGVDVDLFVPMDKEECRRRIGWKNGVKHVLFPANPDRPEKDFSLAASAVSSLGENVQLHVFKDVDHRETVYHYNAADAVLLTSRWEGSPNVIKEALACSCPIVSTDVGDVRERLEGLDGCYVAESRTPEELATYLQATFAFEGRTAGHGKIMSEGLSSTEIASKLMDIYGSALEEFQHGKR